MSGPKREKELKECLFKIEIIRDCLGSLENKVSAILEQEYMPEEKWIPAEDAIALLPGNGTANRLRYYARKGAVKQKKISERKFLYEENSIKSYFNIK